jgi:hypothetical protein
MTIKLRDLSAFLALAGTIAPVQAEVDFNRQIKPILSNRCYACHGPDEEERKAELRFDVREVAVGKRGDFQAIVPGDPAASMIFRHLTSTDPDEMMPPPGKGEPLAAEQIELLRQWVREGAGYDQHWSYKPIVRPPVPKADPGLVANPIDAFLLEELAKSSLSYSSVIDRHRLARRTAMDLTGVPPAPAEVDAFLQNSAPDAFDTYVRAMLAKPAFGEHMARGWLDIARYADSAGYADDPQRTIWGYRDWVIRAYNDNLPFDQFTISQLAGDLLPNPSDDDLTATAFHRNTLTNNEGGTDDEEFRNVAVVDRVNTTFEAWTSTTLACAQCHTHKYDPITQNDYFRVFAIFNNTEDADRRDESPVINLLSPEQKNKRQALTAELAAVEAALDSATPELEAAERAWEDRLKQPANWQAIQPVDFSATDGVTLEARADASFVVSGADPATATYTVRFKAPAALGAIQLEALAAADRPDAGPGRHGNFVLSHVNARWVPPSARPAVGRFVRVELAGTQKFLHLAEVEVMQGSKNLARTGTASQSSTDYGGDASRAIDGNTSGVFAQNSVSHTAASANPWLEIDLGSAQSVDRIVVWNRMDGATPERLGGYRVILLDEARRPVWDQQPAEVPRPSSELTLTGGRNLTFAAAHASVEQRGFPASEVLDAANLATRGKGWAIGAGVGKSQQLVLALGQQEVFTDGMIELTLAQQSPHARHTLGRFRISTVADPAQATVLPTPLRAVVAVERSARSPEQALALSRHYRAASPLLAEQRARQGALKEKIAGLAPATSVPVMRELDAARRRQTRLQIRGNYLNLGDPVAPGVPSAFPPLPAGVAADRLALARWLTSKENPLTARTIVNRLWEQIFGTGIVATSEDFGAQGELPSHRELLDWLAAEFIESGWDTKHMIHLMVTSRAYRQTSRASAELLAQDPANRLLGRGPSLRLTAEEIRDQALAAAGLLSNQMFGPPVRPPKPSYGLTAAFGGGTDWVDSTGPDRYRRGIYTEIRRSSPHPSMTTFDSTSREICTVRRSRSNTPLQALVTFNDPAFVEAAQGFARRLIREHPAAPPAERITAGFRLLIARPPVPAELAALTVLLEQAQAHFASDPPAAMTFASNPLGPLPDGLAPAEAAAWTTVAQALLNMDEVYQKY